MVFDPEMLGVQGDLGILVNLRARHLASGTFRPGTQCLWAVLDAGVLSSLERRECARTL